MTEKLFEEKQIEKKMITALLWVAIVAVIYSLTIAVGVHGRINTIEKSIPTSEVNNKDKCYGTDLMLVSQCLRNELVGFYNYNASNVELYWNNGQPNADSWTDKQWKTIKESGGVCWHYAEWYVMRAKQLGLWASRVRVVLEPSDHAIAIISNLNDTYCVLDQTKLVGCQKVGGNK